MPPGFSLRLNPDEVDDAFEVPLAFLMAPQNHKRENRDWNGLILSVYACAEGAQVRPAGTALRASRLRALSPTVALPCVCLSWIGN